MIKMIKQNLGSALAIGVSGTKEEIAGKMLSLENFGAISAPLHLGSPDTFQYGLSTPEKMLAYFQYIQSLNWDCERIETETYKAFIRESAEKTLEAIPDEVFLRYGEECFSPYSENWENSPESFLCRD